MPYDYMHVCMRYSRLRLGFITSTIPADGIDYCCCAGRESVGVLDIPSAYISVAIGMFAVRSCGACGLRLPCGDRRGVAVETVMEYTHLIHI